MIRIARKSASMSQAKLAERLGVNRKSVIELEKGTPSISLGMAFEAAHLLGIPLMSHDKQHSAKNLQQALTEFEAILPERTSNKEMDDDF